MRVAVGLGLGAFALELEASELGLDPGEALLAARAVAFGLSGVVADDEALGGVAVTDADFLDAQVVLDLAIAARARQGRLGLGHRRSELHPGDVVPARRAQVTQVGLAGEAGVDDVDRAAESPAREIALDLGDDGLVVGVPGPHPAADRDPLARDRQPDHDLRQIGPVVLGVPEPPQRPLAGARLLHVVLIVEWILDVDLEVRRGGVEEDDVDLEIQQRRDAEEDRLLHPLRARQQEVHRAVELVVGERVDAGDDDVAPDPARRLELRGRLQATLADHREDRPLHPRAATARAGDAGDRPPDAQLRPQLADDVRAAGLRRPHELEAVRRSRAQAVLAAEEALDRAHQAHERVAVKQVLAAEVVDHLRHRHAALVALVVRQRQVAHHLAGLRPPRRRSDTPCLQAKHTTNPSTRPTRQDACLQDFDSSQPESTPPSQNRPARRPNSPTSCGSRADQPGATGPAQSRRSRRCGRWCPSLRC